MGDFNNVLDTKLDRFSSHSRGGTGQGGPTPFAKLIYELGLREKEIQGYITFCVTQLHISVCHVLTCAWETLQLRARAVSVTYAPRNISDHSPLIMGINFSQQKQNKLWKVNHFWFALFLTPDPIPQAITEFLHINRGTAKPTVVWDTLKAHMQGLIIRQISKIKTKTKDWENTVMQAASEAEAQYIQDPTDNTERRWLEAQALYQQVSLNAAENKRFFIKQNYFNEGQNTGHLLAVIAKAQQNTAHIEAIQTPLGDTVSDQAQICFGIYGIL